MASGPLCFIRFFEEERFADQFLAGSLYLNTLAYFKGCESENSERNGRFDPTEAVSMWCQPHDVVIKLEVPTLQSVEISKDDLAGPVSFSPTYYDHVHVLCLYSVQLTNFEILNGKIKGKTEELSRDLTIDPRCFDFGEHAVVINPIKFRERLRASLKGQGRLFKTGFVNYYDDSTFHGSIPEAEIPFWKQKRFGFQREYRVCVYPRVKTGSPITIQVGDLSSFCAKMPASKVHTLWSLAPAD
jgi:hypothetical protein